MSKYIDNIAEIANKYQNFIIDLWGVIHDGEETYEHAKAALTLLKAAGKKVLFLSNSPKRSIKSVESLNNMGIDRNMYLDIITSGEFFYINRDKIIDYGYKFYHLGPEYNQDILDDTNFKRVELKNANFILSTGLFNYNLGIQKELDILKSAISKNIPMICINPDIIVITKDGQEYLCAGAIAREYEKLGGQVSYIGKPYIEMYEKAQQILGGSKNIYLAIGDSLRTDIMGAKNFGIDSLFIKSGIHSNELKKNNESELFYKYKLAPSFYTDLFK